METQFKTNAIIPESVYENMAWRFAGSLEALEAKITIYQSVYGADRKGEIEELENMARMMRKILAPIIVEPVAVPLAETVLNHAA